MALPQTVRVKLSSEAAGAITLTPVVVQELPIRELVEHLLGITGKDFSRIREILLRGTAVSGASRFRWAGWEADAPSLQELLATFPDPDPSVAFAPERCVRAILRGPRQALEISREAASQKRLFQRQTFWGVLMSVVAAGPMAYREYSYRARADRFTREFGAAEAEQVRAARGSIGFSTLRDQVGILVFTQADLHVPR